jgi:prophage antirepressor-like protein
MKQMKLNFKLTQSGNFGNAICDFYGSKKDFWVTREQIGQALEYSHPTIAISKLHERHKGRLDKFSVVTKLVSTDGKTYATTVYSPKGIYEICRWSKQQKADAFYDWVYEMLEGLRTGRLRFEEQLTTAKIDYHEVTEAIKATKTDYHNYDFTNEFNMINIVVLGMTAKKFKQANDIPADETSIRPFLTPEQLDGVDRLQKFDANLILMDAVYEDRKTALTQLWKKIQKTQQPELISA